jgi:ethanolamine utilization protein EutN
VIPARVVGRVTGAVKHPAYDGRTLLALRSHRRGDAPGAAFLAVDLVGAGVGDDVLVSRPPGLARELIGGRAPIRSLIVAVLDAPPGDAAP